jgi:hypothetical protein
MRSLHSASTSALPKANPRVEAMVRLLAFIISSKNPSCKALSGVPFYLPVKL